MLMDKQIETIFKKISNDSSLLEKLLKIDDINKLVDFFISLGCEMPKDELTEYLGNMCKNILSDKTMENIAGGKSLTNHNLSKILSTSLATISLANPIISAAPPPKATNPKVQTQTEENTESKTNTALEHVKKHAAEYAIGAGATVGGLVWGAYKLFGDNISELIDLNDFNPTFNPQDLINSVSDTKQISIDDWFNKLCSDVNLDDYSQQRNNYCELNTKNSKAIDDDVPRTNILRCPKTLNPNRSNVNNQLKRILKTYHNQPYHCNYYQNHSNVLGLIYSKCVQSRKITNNTIHASDEAKVYFIYSKFMALFEWFNKRTLENNNYLGMLYAKRFCDACQDHSHFEDIIITISAVGYAYIPILTCAGNDKPLILHGTPIEYDAIFKLWDFILSNNDFLRPNRTGFTIKPTLYALSNILLSHLHLYYKDNPNATWCQGLRELPNP